MKPILLFALLVLQTFANITFGQQICGSPFNPEQVRVQDPERYKRFQQLEQHTARYIASEKRPKPGERLINANSTILIPVVVHVLHLSSESVGSGNNLSVAQIQSQIDVLNEDFRRLNADRTNTPTQFAGVASDPNIEFRLACVDPAGNATTGIHRVVTSVTTFSQNDNMKFTSQGGTDAWPANTYLNIWVCNLSTGLYGYAQFPADYQASPNTDGVVVSSHTFGRTGSGLFTGLDLGRVATHEVGHWLNLRHIWGDDGNACSGSDQCGDTPNQGGANSFNCPTFPHTSCSNGPNGDMFMNYMDYTLDACKNIFTADQTARMRAVFATGGPRASFIDNYFKINESGPICDSAVLTLSNPICLGPITWAVVSGPVTITRGQGTNSITIQRTTNDLTQAVISATAGSYIDDVTVNLGYSNGDDFTISSVYNNNNGNCYGFLELLDLQAFPRYGGSDYAVSYQWSYLKESTTEQTTWTDFPCSYSSCTVSFNEEADYQVRLITTDICGAQSVTIKYITISSSCNGGFRVAARPNPAKNDLYVTVDDGKAGIKSKTGSLTTSVQMELYDLYTGTVVRRWKFPSNQKQYHLNISGLRQGHYVLQVVNGKDKASRQVIIE